MTMLAIEKQKQTNKRQKRYQKDDNVLNIHMCIERPSGKHVVYEVESGELKAAENSRETCRKV